MSDMVSTLLGFPIQPLNRHPLIASVSLQNVPLTSPALCSKGWHGHDCHLNQRKPPTDEKGQTMEQRYQRTQEKIQYIQDNGYPVKQMGCPDV
jgi:hypothetical protein